MKIHCSISDDEFDKIKPWIECSEFRNPFQDEFIFYWPTDKFLFMLAMYGIEYWRSQE